MNIAETALNICRNPVLLPASRVNWNTHSDRCNFIFVLCKLNVPIGWLVGFYGISTFVGYLTLNPFLYKLFNSKQFSMSTQFNCQNIPISSNSV